MGLVDECMPNLPCESRNYFIACYAVSLVQGDTIQGGTIRSRTLKHYVDSAKQLFRRREIATHNPEHTDYVQAIVDALKRYESVPNRRHMISDKMMSWLLERAAEEGPDSITAAIVDWITLGRYTGFRKGEWCQSTQSKYEKIEEWPGQPALAMIASDFVFLGPDEERIDIPDDASYEDLVALIEHLNVTWRKQKNGDNGQDITYSRDHEKPELDAVLAAIRIRLRAKRLGTPAHEPIGVYKNKKGQRKFITDNQVSALLREAAKAALKIEDKKELQKWSAHSIRVTAANLLHRARMTDSYIQKRLRWKSTSFLMYLRNTIYAAGEHTKAMAISESNLPPLSKRAYRELEDHEKVVAPAALSGY